MAKRRRKPKGDCYEAAANLLLDWEVSGRLDALFKEQPPKRAYVVHGSVWGDRIGYHGHAWVEVEWAIEVTFPPPLGKRTIPVVEVYDYSNGGRFQTLRELYYALGRVESAKRYTFDQVRKYLLATRVYGPWEGQDAEDREAADGRAALRVRMRAARRP